MGLQGIQAWKVISLKVCLRDYMCPRGAWKVHW